MVRSKRQHSSETRARQATNEVPSNPNKIGASTPYDFTAKNLTPYGGLLPVATMLEKIGFQRLVEETLTVESYSVKTRLDCCKLISCRRTGLSTQRRRCDAPLQSRDAHKPPVSCAERRCFEIRANRLRRRGLEAIRRIEPRKGG